MVSNNSGTGNARVYRRVGALVRAGVPAFLLVKPLRAYTLTHSKMGKCFSPADEIEYDTLPPSCSVPSFRESVCRGYRDLHTNYNADGF